jgi:tetratricopeptide (TPR) repeat protein
MYLKRTLLSLATCALLAGTAAAQPAGVPYQVLPVPGVAFLPPIAGENSVSNVQVKEGQDGTWTLSYEYFYTGSPPLVMPYLTQKTSRMPGDLAWSAGVPLKTPKRGRQVETFEIRAPEGRAATITEEIRVEFRDLQTRKPVMSAQAPVRIEWLDEATANLDRSIRERGPEAMVEVAATFIDSNNRKQIAEVARPMLERVILKHPRTDAAYLEMARVAMKTSWNPDGLRRAEGLIKSALEIKPQSVDAKILLGYVYAYQKRFKESEPLFEEAAKAGTNNLWLWVDWAELYQMQGRTDEALVKLRVLLDKPPTGDRNDRARIQAYAVALQMLEGTPRLEETERLLRQRVADYGAQGCSGLTYARFLLRERGDSPAAMRLLQAQPAPCGDHTVQELTGVAQYLGWSKDKQTDLLRQARVSFPAGPRLYLELAGSERLAPVLRQLLASGERLDLQDNGDMDALAYALAEGNTAAARRLIAMGAPVDRLEGPEKMPLALIPVLSNDIEGVLLMQKAGVDYRKLRFRGATAFDHAKEMGDEKLLRALGVKSGNL